MRLRSQEAVGPCLRQAEERWQPLVGAARASFVMVSAKGLEMVQNHLKQFGDVAVNTASLARLRVGAHLSGGDANFYLHEINQGSDSIESWDEPAGRSSIGA